MKVLKHGKNFNNKILECRNCECRFQYDDSDVEMNFFCDEKYIICPECGEEIRIAILIKDEWESLL